MWLDSPFCMKMWKTKCVDEFSQHFRVPGAGKPPPGLIDFKGKTPGAPPSDAARAPTVLFNSVVWRFARAFRMVVTVFWGVSNIDLRVGFD